MDDRAGGYFLSAPEKRCIVVVQQHQYFIQLLGGNLVTTGFQHGFYVVEMDLLARSDQLQQLVVNGSQLGLFGNLGSLVRLHM